MPHHLHVERRHNKPTPAGVLHQAIGLEQQQRLLDRLAGHAKALGEEFLDKMRVGGKRAVGAFAEQGLIGLFDQAGLRGEQHHARPHTEF